MSIVNQKDSLFRPGVVFQPPHLHRSWAIRQLDSRVGEVALKVLAALAVTVAGAIIIGASLYLGWTLIPIAVLVASVGTAALCIYTNSCLKKYYREEYLQKYRLQAELAFARMDYLDKMDILGSISDQQKKEVKSELIRPLTYLMKAHGSLETLLKYRILSPQGLENCFTLEVKYLALPQSFELYQKIVKAAEAVGYDLTAFETEVRDQWWIEALNSHIKDMEGEFTSKKFSNEDPLGYQITRLQEIVDLIEGYYENGILVDKEEEFTGIKQALERSLKECERLLSKCPHSKKARDMKHLGMRLYTQQPACLAVYHEQVEILKGVAAIQAEHELALQAVRSDFRKKLEAIRLRCSTTVHEKEDDKQQILFFEKHQKQEEDKLQADFQRKLDVYMKTGLSAEARELLSNLHNYKQSLDRERDNYFAKDLAGPIALFVRMNEVELEEKAKKLLEHHTTFNLTKSH